MDKIYTRVAEEGRLIEDEIKWALYLMADKRLRKIAFQANGVVAIFRPSDNEKTAMTKYLNALTERET